MKFGFLSYEAALQAMPDYTLVQKNLADLKAQYQTEAKRVEDEFNRKYEEFLEGQREFPKTILQKRQSELQELMQKNIEFKQQGLDELAKAEQESMAPLRIKLIEALGKIGRERGYAFIVNTDEKVALWLNPTLGEDITAIVKEQLLK